MPKKSISLCFYEFLIFWLLSILFYFFISDQVELGQPGSFVDVVSLKTCHVSSTRLLQTRTVAVRVHPGQKSQQVRSFFSNMQVKVLPCHSDD